MNNCLFDLLQAICIHKYKINFIKMYFRRSHDLKYTVEINCLAVMECLDFKLYNSNYRKLDDSYKTKCHHITCTKKTFNKRYTRQ